MKINDYLEMVDKTTQGKILLIIHYIVQTYPNVVFDDHYSSNTKIPTYRYNDTYVSIACMKKYITIHFGNPESVKMMVKECEKIRGNIGCVNMSYHIELPYAQIYKAIDITFRKS